MYDGNVGCEAGASGGDGNDTILLGGNKNYGFANGDAGDDIIDASAANDVNNLRGGAGNDTIIGSKGNERLDGDDGNDNISAGDGINYVFAGNGLDTITSGSANDFLYGGNDADSISGGGGNDELYGEAGNDSLNGEAGYDTLQGGAGNDLFFASAGNDLFYGYTNTAKDPLTTALDSLKLSGSSSDYTISKATDATFGVVYYIQDIRAGSPDGLDTLYSIGQLQFSDLTIATEDYWKQFQYGGSGDDLIIGLAGRDFLLGLGGNDKLDAGDGPDQLFGGLGNDTMDGGAGIDVAVFSGLFSNYSFAWDGSTLVVTGSEGVDRLTNIEALRFDDKYDVIGKLPGINRNPVVNGSLTLPPSANTGKGILMLQSQLLANVTDPDGQPLTALNLSVDPANGTLVANPDGSWTFTPATGKTGTIAFSYEVSDGYISVSTSASLPLLTNDGQALFRIDGIAAAGQTLSATELTADPDGAPTSGYSYQWQASADGNTWSNLGTASSQLIAPAQAGQKIRLLVSYLDAKGNSEALTLTPLQVAQADTGDASFSITSLGASGNARALVTGMDANDPDGTSNARFSYNWQLQAAGQSWVDSGSTNQTFAIGNIADGTLVRALINYLDDKGNPEAILTANTYTVLSNRNSTGGATKPKLSGTAKDEILIGADTASELYSAGGNDIVLAGGSDDLIVGGDGAGDDVYDGGDGSDTVRYTSAVNYSINVNLETRIATGQEIGTDVLIAIENIIAGSQGDTLVGNSGANLIDGQGGNDTISGRGGNDSLIGGLGDDTAVFANASSTYSFSWDGDTILVSDATGTAHLSSIETLQFADRTGSVTSFAALNRNPLLSSAQTSLTAGLEDSAVTITAAQLLAGFSDPDGDSLSINSVSASSGSITANADGSYTLTPAANVNGLITLSYTVADSRGGSTAASLGLTLNPVDDVATGSLTTSGTAAEGSSLSAALANAVDPDGAITATSFQWEEQTALGWIPIAGQSGAGLTIPADQSFVGKTVRVVVTTTDAVGGITTFTGTPQVIANVNDTPVGGVSISGTPIEGQTLSASSSLSDGDGLGTISYSWFADGASIGTGDTFTLTNAQVGKAISVTAAYTDGQGTAESVSSLATAAVAALVTNSNFSLQGNTYNDGNTRTSGNGAGGYLLISSYKTGDRILIDAGKTYWFVDNTTTADGKTGIGVYLNDGSGTGSKATAWDSRDELLGLITATGFSASQFKLSADGTYFSSSTTPPPPATTPAISLSVAPASVAEDGTTNLVYTFTRTGDTASALTVGFALAGSASLGSDYTSTGLISGTSQTITFLAGSATATLTVDPTADATVEANETVELTLTAGSGYTLATTSAVVGTITNDDSGGGSGSTLSFTSNRDSLTGTSSSDTFQLTNLNLALLGTTNPVCDRIIGLNANADSIDGPRALTLATAIKPSLITTPVPTLTATEIAKVLTSRTFKANAAAAFTYNDTTAGTRTFLALNDATAGFSASTDAIIEITGYSGSITNLAVF